MKRFIKKALGVFFILITVSAVAVIGLFARIYHLESKLHPVTTPFGEMTVITMCVDRIFPLSDYEKSFGFSDYVFIGTVEEIIGTDYDDISLHRFRLIESIPETHFRVKTIHNIKGTAPKEFTLKTCGGQQPDGSLEQFHHMPEKNSTCLFMCTENDGYLYFFNCVYLGDAEWAEKSENLLSAAEEYEKIYENEDLSVRKYR